MNNNCDQRCTVLLLGGASGTGKSTVAANIGQQAGVPWLQVDDLRLALQRSRASLPEGNDALYFFTDIENKPTIWRQAPETLRDALIAVGEAMSPAIEAVIANHVDQAEPIIIEGDGVLPALVTRPAVRKHVEAGAVRAVFLVEPCEQALYDNMLARARGIAAMSDADLRSEARAKWLFDHWLTAEAARLGLPVVSSRPWANLVSRVREVYSA